MSAPSLPQRLGRLVQILQARGASALASEVCATLVRTPVESLVMLHEGHIVLVPYWELFALEVEALPPTLSRAHIDWLWWVWRTTLGPSSASWRVVTPPREGIR